MEDILASIKRVIDEDVKPASQRGARPRADPDDVDEDDVLELDASLMQLPPAPAPTEPSLVSQSAYEATRNSLAALSALKAVPVPGAAEGPLEAAVRDMLRPMLRDWLDQRLPGIVEDIVAREVARITGRG